MAANYTEASIKTLSSLEHIRLRPGMYIGKLGDGSQPEDGIYVLLKEVVDNCIDEHVMGYGKVIEIEITEDNHASTELRVSGMVTKPRPWITRSTLRNFSSALSASTSNTVTVAVTKPKASSS